MEFRMSARPLALACLVLALVACKPSTPAEPASTTDAATASAAPAVAAEDAATLATLPAPMEAVKGSMDTFLGASSFHATMVMEGAKGMTTEMDFVAPDRYRLQMPVGTQVIIGDTMYMQAGGKTMKVPLPAGTISQWRDPLKIQENKDSLSVESQGGDTVDGIPATKYLVRNTLPTGSTPASGEPGVTEFTYWVGEDGLPLQLQHSGESQGKPYSMTIRYTRFNDPGIVIDTPK
jgi:hypothetical protein